MSGLRALDAVIKAGSVDAVVCSDLYSLFGLGCELE
jgi:hypothetical protein